MAQSPIQAAIAQICQEKGLSEEAVIRAIELALAAAYRKDFGNKLQNIMVSFDVKTGAIEATDVKTVVEDLPGEELTDLSALLKGEMTENSYITPEAETEEDEDARKFNPKTEIPLSEARVTNPEYNVGDEIITPLETAGEFGRMAAQTAKQVIIQKLREVERENIFNEYKSQEGQVINGAIQRRDGRNVLVDLEHAVAILPADEQVPGERYNVGNRMRFFLKIVDQSVRGPQLILSRSSVEIVKQIFESEIPEIANGLIEIKSIAREAGNRSKVAIRSLDDSIDPIGSCVGQRGSRIQTIISELGGEKIDIILWDDNAVRFITNALSPAKVASVELIENEDGRVARVTVKEDQLSLAIGRSGQNVRLASRLTDWRIDIIPEDPNKVVEETPASDDTTSEATGEAEEMPKPKKKAKAKRARVIKDDDEE